MPRSERDSEDSTGVLKSDLAALAMTGSGGVSCLGGPKGPCNTQHDIFPFTAACSTLAGNCGTVATAHILQEVFTASQRKGQNGERRCLVRAREENAGVANIEI